MQLIAHRGCRLQYPENTIRAIQSAAPHVDFVEIDIKRCGSGEIVLLHDDSLGRLTDVDADVTDTDWAVLRELSVGESDEPIPRLEDALDAWPDDTGLNLDVHDDDLVPDLADLRGKLPRPTVISSSNVAVHRRCRALDIDVMQGYSFLSDPSAHLDRAVELGCEYVHVWQELCLGTDVVDEAHERGLLVDAWSIQDPDRAIELRDRGVDALTVDRWDVV